MKRFTMHTVLMFLLFCTQGLYQANAQKCQRTNSKPWRYCVDGDQCTTDKDCGKKEKCLCDGDCGLSCIKDDLKCDNLRKSRNTILNFTGASGFQQTVAVSCKDGYTLRGSKKRTCRGIGKWDGRNTRCPKLCEAPGDIAYGNKNSDRKYFKVGSTVNYWCFPGYELQGSSKIKCTKAGIWSASPPKCTLPTCQKPVIPQNARSSRKLKAKYKYNEVVFFMCEHGYFTAGGRIQRCLQLGKWSGSQLRCIPKSCGDPGTPKNGRRRGYVFTFKRKVYYECSRGYIRLGPEFRQCHSNQKWSGDTPTCEPIDCMSLPTPQNGQKIEETKTTFQGRVTFECKKKGYELQGSATRVCQEDGKWDGTRTTCDPVECKDPGKPNKGGRKPELNKYVYENKVTFECKKNHTLKGNSFIICQHDKSWTGDVPKCLAPCPDPGVPSGGYRHHHSFLHGEKVTFSCKNRWKMEGEKTLTCTDGKWDHDAPKCFEGCTTPRSPDKGGIYSKKNFYYNGQQSSFYCYDGYKRVGDYSATCRNGKWNNDPPSCKRKCDSPGSPYNGWKNGIEYFEGKKVTFTCSRGYDLIGLQAIQCLNTGSWSGSVPECKKRCNVPRVQYSVTTSASNPVQSQTVIHGTSITYTCRSGYILVGQSTLSCADGRWDSSSPQCKAPCSDPGAIQNGGKNGNDFSHEKTVRYYCFHGYTLDGSRLLRCNDGGWNKPVPTCKASCVDPGVPFNGIKQGDSFQHGQQVTFTCLGRTSLVGFSQIACDNGKWSNKVPQCLGKCNNPGSPSNGRKNGNEYFEGKKVTFTCSRGYDLIGLQAIQCLNTGSWSESVPECKKRCNVHHVPYVYSVITGASNPIQSQTIIHGTSITYTCRSGYILVGQSTLSCDDGRWSSRFPQCKASCSNPGSIQNGKKNGNDFSHGKTVNYFCDMDYTLDGSGQLTCNNGKWDKPVPTCKESCSDPGVLRKGIKHGDRFEHGKRVSYTCNSRTQLVGSHRLTCDDGKWSSEVPKCLETCQNLGSPVNGYKREMRIVSLSGDKITFYCNSWKYDLVGSKEILCVKGTWNGSVPQCLGRCKVPNNIGSVQIQTHSIVLKRGFRTWYKHATRLRFGCNPGQVLDGESDTTCINGGWSKDFPACKVPCNEPGPIRNGTQHGSKFQFQFDCDDGFTLIGQSTILCNNQGVWSDDPPQCFRNCQDPVISNGFIRNKNLQHGHWNSFWCYHGYDLKGTRTLQCNNGQWSDKIPTCIGKCPRVYAPHNGALLDHNFESGSTVRFRCNQGYTLRGPHNITCQDKTWSHKKMPVCKADCADPGVPNDGQRHGDAFSFGSYVDFTCNHGTTLIGSARLHCQDGGWSYRKPVCEAKCKDTGSPPNATRQLGFSKEGRQTLTYSCPSFMSVIGKRVLTCKQGTWSHDLPSCSDCGVPLGLENKKIPDDNIIASSHKDWGHRPRYGRLNHPRAWCSARAWSPNLEIDLGKPYRITYLATQGSERDKNWVKQYIVGHTLARSSFIDYRENQREKVFTGNKDATSIVRHKLKNPFIARKVRFYPYDTTGYLITRACMRVEIYGCDIPTDCVMVGSRVLGKWTRTYSGVDKYYKAYVKTISGNTVQLDLENEDHDDRYFKYSPKTSIVLDVPPKQVDLREGIRVLASWKERYFSGTIRYKNGKHYYVKTDDSEERYYTIDKLRRLKSERFCE